MRLALAAYIIILLTSGSAQGSDIDPPSRVARIRSVEGVTTIHDGGTSTATSVTRNWPIASGDEIRTHEASHAEVDFGDVLLALDASSELTIEELKPDITRLAITRGTADITASDGRHETFDLRLTNASIQISAPGEYRLEVRANGDARMIVRRGAAQIRTGHVVFEQDSDEEVAIAHEGTFAIAPAPAVDEPARGRAGSAPKIDGTQTAKHVTPGLVGYKDLDPFGVWRWNPAYGMMWEPVRVARDWAPYRFGRWIWKAPWGWTWVDDAPWGFAPFHYGRWAYFDARWLWVPGPRQVPATYAPALVRWERAKQGSVDWYPLAPGEEYVPPYPASDLYKRSVNLFAVVSSRIRRAQAEPLTR